MSPTIRIAALSLGLCTAFGCDEGRDDSDGTVWWDGVEEPARRTSTTGVPTIFLRSDDPKVRRVLDGPTLGALTRAQTGTLELDGHGLSEEVTLLFDGELRRYDGGVDRVQTLVSPQSRLDDPTQPDGWRVLTVDFKDERGAINLADGRRLGMTAGVFSGEIIATTALSLDDAPPADVRALYLRPDDPRERPPNRLEVDLHIAPVAALSRLAPVGADCSDAALASAALAGTELTLGVTLEGFPDDEPVDVQLRMVMADGDREDADALPSAPWDAFVESWFGRRTLNTWTRTVTGPHTVDFGTLLAESAPWGHAVHAVQFEVSASMPGAPAAFAEPTRHQLTIAEPGERVIVDPFELCPVDDAACRKLRDRTVPDNVRARRASIEAQAQAQGLYDGITRPLSECQAGPTDEGSSCQAYREHGDTTLQARVATELQFELSVNGQRHRTDSWDDGAAGLSREDIAEAFASVFALPAEPTAAFVDAPTWRDRTTLDTTYDPQRVQMQWWRVATPHLRHLEVAQFDACGEPEHSDHLVISELRDDRLVLACEAATAERACTEIEPTDDAVAACEALLVAANDTEPTRCSG